MAKPVPDYKSFTMRIPKDMMLFLKRMSAEKEKPMATLLLDCFDKYRKRVEAKDNKE